MRTFHKIYNLSMVTNFGNKNVITLLQNVFIVIHISQPLAQTNTMVFLTLTQAFFSSLYFAINDFNFGVLSDYAFHVRTTFENAKK